MKRLVSAIAAGAPLAASAEVLDKQPSIAFLLAAAGAAGFLAYTAARCIHTRLALLGLLPLVVFLPALSEQLDPVMRSALLAEGGVLYNFSVWLGPASVLAAFAVGLRRRSRPLHKPVPSVLFFTAATVLGGLALSTLSGLSPVWACLVVAGAILANGIVAAVEDRHA